ncbi:MAG: hypothetical protein ACT6Q8_02880 [Niveispirillum sp.]|uniref:hypothetical protein n=1 Tax=Niveispirillum sp. TaxID=1917217 RepID=UPI004036F4FA
MTKVLTACLLVMLQFPSVSATIIAEVIHPPQLLQSADGRSRFTVTEICRDNAWPLPLDAPYVPQRPVGEQQYMSACPQERWVFIGEFASKNDNGTWGVLWTKPLPVGIPKAEWLMSSGDNLLATLWFDSKEKADKVLIFNLNGNLLYAYRIDAILRDAGLPWEGSIVSQSYWKLQVRFTDDHLALQIEAMPKLESIWEKPSAPLHAKLSLSDGKLSLADSDRWAVLQREMECRLMVHDANMHAYSPDIVWNDKGEGKSQKRSGPLSSWNEMTALLTAFIAPFKANILLGLGISCHRSADGSAPP